MSTPAELVGKTFGRLKVRSRSGSDNFGRALWLCDCECGGTTTATTGHLKANHTQSCECLQKERAMENCEKRQTSHGHAKAGHLSPTYYSWMSMKSRCTNPTFVHYAQYGGAGVTIAPEWMTFNGFLTSLGERLPDTTLGRCCDLGNYETGNAFWMTIPEQMLARRNKRALLKFAAQAA